MQTFFAEIKVFWIFLIIRPIIRAFLIQWL